MRPVGGPAPGYYPPTYEAERPTAQAAGNDRARSSQASSSPAASVAPETPMLGDLKRFPAGRYPDMKVENIRLKIEGQEPGGKEGVKHTRRRKPDAAGSSHVHGGQSVASTSASSQSKAKHCRIRTSRRAILPSSRAGVRARTPMRWHPQKQRGKAANCLQML